MKTQSSDNILAFTGLRAFACTLVILCHTSVELIAVVPVFYFSGIPAVYLFFVLSGYLLMKRGLLEIQPSIDAVPQRFFNTKLISYLIRRFMRVYPAYLITVLLYKKMTWYITASKYHEKVFGAFDHPVWKSLYFDGVRFHFWTLQVEMTFFMAFLPVVYVIAAECKILDYKYLRHLRFKTIYLFYAITTIIISYIQYRNGNVNRGTKSDFGLYLPAFWHGCLGGIASYHFKLSNMKIPTDTPLRKWIVELVTWGLVLRFTFGNKGVIEAHTTWNPEGWWNNAFLQTPFKAAFLFILEFTHETNSIARAMSLPFFQYLGKISYSTYLMHMCALILYKMHTKIRGELGTFEGVVVSYVFGAIMYHTVETRGVKYGENAIKWIQRSKFDEKFRKWLQRKETGSAYNEVATTDIEMKAD